MTTTLANAVIELSKQLGDYWSGTTATLDRNGLAFLDGSLQMGSRN
jgi:hypothetical protein